MDKRRSQTTRARVPVPKGGFDTNEDEARWLEQTLLLGTQELFAAAGIPSVSIKPVGLYDLLLISLNSAGDHAVKGRRPAEIRR
jgi:hypothetical protein